MHQVLANLQNHIRTQTAEVTKKITAGRGVISSVLNFMGLGDDALADDASMRFLQRLQSFQQDALDSLQQETQMLQQRNLPAAILERQQAVKNQLIAQYTDVLNKLSAVVEDQSLVDQQQKLDALNSLLKNLKTRKSHEVLDPDNLPWGTPDPELTPEPAQSAGLLSQRYDLPLFEQGVQLASNIITPDMLGNPGGPTQADLDATLDAPLSEIIRAKATELNHDPVAIYQWVRNHIEFIPSYGSIQGAEYTLRYGKGNAFDTASLLIALLRAANIPARYAFGTVRMPVDTVKNWVGNVQSASAAGNLLGQGGIPAKGLVSGGQVQLFELEHVWVEAWIDYLPSRGAKHSVGDSWIPMDASYKQYEYQDGMGLDQAVPFDAQTLVDNIQQNATVNEDEGWVQGLPQQDIEQALNTYQQQLEHYINNQNPDATVGDVLGTSSIKTVIRESLAASLPYELSTRKLVASSLTDAQRWKFKYELSGSYNGQPTNTLLSINEPTVKLAGKALSLSYTPASEDDEQLILSFLPEPDDNGEIDPAAIPDTLPGYLIHLNGEFAIGDTVVATTDELSMGTELISESGFWEPVRGWQTSRNQPVVGEYRAIALDLHGISQAQAETLKDNLEVTQQNLESETYTDFTKQDLVGDLLYSTILSYFALNNLQDTLQSKSANIIGYRAPSYGLFKTNIVPQYWFGVPRNVQLGGLTMDVDRVSNLQVETSNNSDNWLAYNRAQGARMSAMEHLVPEQMFTTADNPAYGISAVKAIQLATAEGQKIWTITQANIDIALPNINLPDDVMTEIRHAIRTGKEVTTHEKPLDFYGSSQFGYIILDPQTGAGAYKIGGGENGAFLVIFGLSILLIFGVFAFVTGGVGALFAFALINSALANIAAGVALIAKSLGQDGLAYFACSFAFVALSAVLSAVLAAFTALGAVASGLVSEIASILSIFSGC
ncbi:transglutaminase domain-containing protein [Bacterioplanoides pacificum]|uniref:Transglutaminase domain-containing protein n=1 Tax=Bacterioplanoides pacificum TaxID=1171596 RepID=A0ABV7VUY9_9GAMM